MYTDLIGYSAGALTAICFVPQIAQTIKTRRAEDVSLWMLLLTLASVALYEIYSLLLALWPVVIMNGIFLLLVICELALKVTFDRKRGTTRRSHAD